MDRKFLYLIILLLVSAGFAEEIPTVSISISKTIASEKNVVISSGNFTDSLNETLKDNNIDIQRNTVHPNISLKGATFQQSSIFVDGVKADDPQTAHNNLNIPVSAEDIEKIEVLSDRGLAGAINIVTKKPDNRISADISAGDFTTKNGRISISRKWDKFADRLSFEKKVSNGFSFDTDYDIINFSNRFEWKYSELETGFLFGYLKKNIGARGFYADYPSYEWTKTYLSKIDFNYEYNGFIVKPEFQWKQNNDEFELDITKPGWSFNKHKTDAFTTQVAILKNGFSLTPVMSSEKIESSNLGDHTRNIYNFLSDYNYRFTENINAAAGLQLDKFSNDSVVSPSIFVSYRPLEKVKIHSMFRKSARQPSFTELYYEDKANISNPDLGFEKATLYETGADCKILNLNLNLNLFLRDEKDIIDWIRWNTTQKWQATNIGNARFYGYEFGFTEKLYKISSTIKYTYTNSEKDADFISKYAMRYAQHLLTGGFSYPVIWKIENSVDGIYKKRISGEEYFVMDTKLAKKFSFGEYYIEVNNLLDKNYTEIPFVPMPPRIVNAGIKLAF